MKPGNNIDKRIEQTLNSLDGIQQAEPRPWLYTRIMKRLEKEEDRSIWGVISSFLAKPAVAIAGLFLILLLNGFLLFKEQQDSDSLAIEPVVDSESLMASSSFEYENLVQP